MLSPDLPLALTAGRLIGRRAMSTNAGPLSVARAEKLSLTFFHAWKAPSSLNTTPLRDVEGNLRIHVGNGDSGARCHLTSAENYQPLDPHSGRGANHLPKNQSPVGRCSFLVGVHVAMNGRSPPSREKQARYYASDSPCVFSP